MHYQHCAALNKNKVPCGNNGNCPAHREANAIRRRQDDEARMSFLRQESQQLTLFPKLSLEQIQQLVRAGYESEVKTTGSAPCGCQG